jgi:hypothetical protein
MEAVWQLVQWATHKEQKIHVPSAKASINIILVEIVLKLVLYTHMQTMLILFVTAVPMGFSSFNLHVSILVPKTQ